MSENNPRPNRTNKLLLACDCVANYRYDDTTPPNNQNIKQLAILNITHTYRLYRMSSVQR